MSDQNRSFFRQGVEAEAAFSNAREAKKAAREKLAALPPKPPPVFEDTYNNFDPSRTVTREEVGAALDLQQWTYAKSMPQWPHWWIVRRHWGPEMPMPWGNMIQHVWDNSFPGWFGKRKAPRKYWVWNGYIYWPMDPTPESTDLLNKAVDEVTNYHHVERPA